MSGAIRILLLADSHLGFDLPVRPRVDRRRRGHDFLANYAAALAPALAGHVDIVVHGGDVFNRSRVEPSLAYQAFEPLRRVADRGVPVFIVPGNHERSRLPHMRFASHRGVHVFDSPRTFGVDIRGTRIALAGFPYERRHVRARFADLAEQTGWMRQTAQVRLLCMHHCVEGASVGPADYTFTTASDVVRLRDVPAGFAAVLSGHIHRHQVLTTDLGRRPLATPVLYPGSIERTSVAEIGETKGYLIVRVMNGTDGKRVGWQFCELPSRPMIRRDLVVDGLDATSLASAVREIIEGSPHDAVVSIRLSGALTEPQWQAISAARLRAMAPDTMNVEITPGVVRPRGSRPISDAQSSSRQPWGYRRANPDSASSSISA